MPRLKLTQDELKERRKERDRIKQSRCKEKEKERLKEHYEKNKVKAKERYEANKDKIRQKYQLNKDKHKENYLKKKVMKDAKVFEDYEIAIRKAPNHVCNSCHNVFFERSLSKVKTDNLPSRLIQDIEEGMFFACSSCKTYIRKKEVPPMFHGNWT